jgi:hypothetical protein
MKPAPASERRDRVTRFTADFGKEVRHESAKIGFRRSAENRWFDCPTECLEQDLSLQPSDEESAR